MNITTNFSNADVIACYQAVTNAKALVESGSPSVSPTAVAAAEERLNALLASGLNDYEKEVVAQIQAAMLPV